jgi:hypothetical protein
MLVVVKTPPVRVHVGGTEAKTVMKALRKLYDSVEGTEDEQEPVDITTADWWKEIEAVSRAGTVLGRYCDTQVSHCKSLHR